MNSEAPALRIKIGHHHFTVGAAPHDKRRLSVVCECTPEQWEWVIWPTDDQLSDVLGVGVRYVDAGQGQFEAVYAFEKHP